MSTPRRSQGSWSGCAPADGTNEALVHAVVASGKPAQVTAPTNGNESATPFRVIWVQAVALGVSGTGVEVQDEDAYQAAGARPETPLVS